MGKNTKVMPQKTSLSIFSLGKGRESLRLQTLHKKLSKSVLSALPPARKNILIQTMCGRRTPKLTKINSLFLNFCTFPVTEWYTICHSISSSQPQQESSPTEQNSSTQKDTNFGNAMFLRYLRPEKRQKSYPEKHEFQKRHVSSLPEARKMPKILPRKT